MLNEELPPFVVNTSNVSFCQRVKFRNAMVYESIFGYIQASLIICVINTITNLVAYVIFYQDHVVSTFNRLLMNLSLCEACFQIFYVLCLIIEYNLLLKSVFAFSTYNRAIYFGYFYLFVILPLFTACHIARNWAVVLISVYRFETLVRAFSTKWLLFRKGADIKICVVFFLLSILIALPRSIERNIYCCISDNEETFSIVAFDYRAGKNTAYKYFYFLGVLFIFQNGGPAILVCVIGGLIIIKLAERRKIKERLIQGNKCPKQTQISNSNVNTNGESCKFEVSHSCNNQDQSPNVSSKPRNSFVQFRRNYLNQSSRRINRRNLSSASHSSRGGRLILILSVIFVLCELPSFINKLLGTFKVNANYFVMLANMATLVDSFVNFFIYLLSNKRFRQNLCTKLHFNLCYCCHEHTLVNSNTLNESALVTVHR